MMINGGLYPDISEKCFEKLSHINQGHHNSQKSITHDDVIKCKHLPRNWQSVRGIQRSPMNSPHKDQWRWALMFHLICALNKRLFQRSWGWWSETLSRSLWRHCYVGLNELAIFSRMITIKTSITESQWYILFLIACDTLYNSLS